jgi:hypothetical protein
MFRTLERRSLLGAGREGLPRLARGSIGAERARSIRAGHQARLMAFSPRQRQQLPCVVTSRAF